MDINKTVSVITKAGAVIISTLTSFLVKPPVIAADENDGVAWKNIFVFVAGVLSILLYSWIRKKINRRSIGILLISLLVIIAGIYEVIYYENSINCWGQVRCVISSAPVKNSEVAADLEGWKLRSHEPVKELMQAYRCSPLEVWNMSALALPYYSMLVLYLAAILVLTLLLLFISELLTSKI